ncbi:MAG: protein kinase [Polyangiaceae bacterium]
MFPAEPVPDKIGGYQVLKYLGRVGASDVYVARMEGPLGFARDVTLKMVRFAVDEDAHFAEDLAREAAICARLNHPVVVRMYDFFEHDRRLVLVLEQVEGASLDRLITHVTRRKQRVGDAATIYIGAQLAAALAHAHGSADEDGNLSPVIHRDIKPENVLIGWDGQVRLAGFALGKILGRTPDSVVGTVRGTPGYMAPEQARGERATIRSDVYGFGVLLWSLLVGREPPLDGARPQPLAELRPDLPKELIATVDAALEPLPDKRRITAAEMANWLSKLTKMEAGREELRQKVLFLRATRGPASKLDPSPKTQPRPQRRRTITQTGRSRRPSSVAPSPRSTGRPAATSSRPASGAPMFPAEETTLVSGLPAAGQPASARPAPSSTGTTETSVSRAYSVREGSGLLRIPPPPPLPNEDGSPKQEAPATRRNGVSNGPPAANGVSNGTTNGTNGVHGTNGRSTPPNGSQSGRPPVSVRTVSAPPPPRSVSTRPAVAPENYLVLAPPPPPSNDLPAFLPPPEPWLVTNVPLEAARTSDSGAAVTNPILNRSPANASTTFPIAAQLVLAGLTASLVVALGLLFLQMRGSQNAPPQQQPAQVVTVEVNRERAAGGGADRPPPPPTPEPTAVASASATPAATGTPNVVPGSLPDPSTLADTMGYLMVKGPESTFVYLNGAKRGPTNEFLLVPCGTFFMRIALPDAGTFPTGQKFPTWKGPGQTAHVECRSSTVLTVRGADDENKD